MQNPTFWADPDLSAAAFVALCATVIGEVFLGEGSSVWYGAVLRGDVERIEIGVYTNIQDGCILHGDPGQITKLGDYVTVGHRAVIHGAQIEDGCLIGIGSIILNGVTIGAGSMIGAGSVVTKDIPAQSLAVGIPARVVRSLTTEEVADLITHAQNYQKLALVHAGKGNDLGFTKAP